MEAMTTDNKNSAGELLKQGRLRQRLSIAECAKRTHISSRFLEALEEEKWSVLPSESHRLGFMKLYSRFLGVPVEDVLTFYRQKTDAPAAAKTAPAPEAAARPERRKSQVHIVPRQSAGLAPVSIQQVIGAAIVILIVAWGAYHVMNPHGFDQSQMPWIRHRLSAQSRLLGPKASVTAQKVRIQAEADSWLRVTMKNELLYEGILPAGSVKEWSGIGPFQFKIGNVKGIAVFWNDQPFDVLAGARGLTNEIRIPPQ
jgi:cytoskeletal protein RodZ